MIVVISLEIGSGSGSHLRLGQSRGGAVFKGGVFHVVHVVFVRLLAANRVVRERVLEQPINQ